jgi:hypothetical protein
MKVPPARKRKLRFGLSGSAKQRSDRIKANSKTLRRLADS